MAKAQPFMTVQFNVSRDAVMYAAEAVTDYLFDEFSCEVFEMMDFSGKEFRKELLEFEPFLKCVREAIQDNGSDALEYPYDYIDFDTVYATKEWKTLFRVFCEMQTILDEVERAESATSNACADAIETLKRAGFKIVKA